jgi:hypothetical protein
MKRRLPIPVLWILLILVGLAIGLLMFFTDGRHYFTKFYGERLLLGLNLTFSLLYGVGIVLFIRSFILLISNEVSYRRGTADEHRFWNNVGGVVLTLIAIGGLSVSLSQDLQTVRSESSQTPVQQISGRSYSDLVACQPLQDVKIRVGPPFREATLQGGGVYDVELCEGLSESDYNVFYDNYYFIFDRDDGLSDKLLPVGTALATAIPFWLIIRAVRDILRALAKLKPTSEAQSTKSPSKPTAEPSKLDFDEL